jgi:hypothetical protein
MRILTVVVLMLLFFSSCNQKKKNILPPDKMQTVMWDMMRADKFLADFVLNKDSSKKKDTESIKLYREILAIHQINGEQFSYSFNYYKNDPGELKWIMDSISRQEVNQAPTTPLQPQVATQQPQPLTDTNQQKKDTLSPGKVRKIIQTQ